MTSSQSARDLALALADLIDQKQGKDIVILDVSGPLVIADYFVIASARNARHAQAIGTEVTLALKAQGRPRRGAAGTEGENHWVLVDFDEVVVHVFEDEARTFYDLESLWADVPRIPFTPTPRPQPVEEPGPDSIEPL